MIKRSIYLKLAAWLPAIIMAYIISGFSAQDGEHSQGLSNKIAGYIVEFAKSSELIEGIEGNENLYIEKLQVPIRKGAHMAEYAVFSACCYFALWVWSLKRNYRYFAAVLIAFLYAATDEIHQLFVPGRTGQLKDVFIDTLGAILMMLILYLINKMSKKKG